VSATQKTNQKIQRTESAVGHLFCPSNKVQLKEETIGLKICEMICISQKYNKMEHLVKVYIHLKKDFSRTGFFLPIQCILAVLNPLNC